MTGQLLMSASAASLSISQNLVGGSNATGNASPSSSTASSSRTYLVELTKSLYQADHQAEFLHLQAETEALLSQLQRLKQQRSDLTEPNFCPIDASSVNVRAI